MITSIEFVPITGSALSLDSDPPGIVLQEFDPSISDRVDTSRERSQAQGFWPTYPYEGGMEIRCSGEIFGSDSDDYTSRRHSFLSLFRFPTGPTERRHGHLDILFDGEAEHWLADVYATSVSMPRDTEGWARSAWSIVFASPLPYFIGATSGDPHYDA